MHLIRIAASCALALTLTTPAFAHFGMVIPDAPIIDKAKRQTSVTVSFSHPFEMKGMDMERPQTFALVRQDDGKTERTDLLANLKETRIMGKAAWKTEATFPRPGVYQFIMEPKPYWEPQEDSFIQHTTKTIVPAFGAEEGWDTPAGLKFEIVPLTRPYANYAGNSFTGQVLLDGKPLSGAAVEVEFYNSANRYEAPTEQHVTQVVKADERGVFTFTCPLAGWWGFAALTKGPEQLKGPDGKLKDVEIGAVLWTHFTSFKTKK